MSKPITVFIPAGGGPTTFSLINYLRSHGDESYRFIISDTQADSIAAHVADTAYISPNNKSDEYEPFILDVCCKEDVNVIIPVISSDALFFSKRKAKFNEKNIAILVSDYEAVKTSVDKTACYDRLKQSGFAVPEHIEVRSVDEFHKAAAKLGYPGCTICMKPARYPDGSGKGFRVIDPDANIHRRMFWESTANMFYVDYQAVVDAMKHEAAFPPMLVMEWLPGDEYSVYCLCQHGHAAYIVPNLRRKLFLMNSLEAEIKFNEEIITMCDQICQTFKFDYCVNIQIKYSDAGIPKVVEINPRFAGTILLPAAAGIDLVSWSIKMGLGKPFPEKQPINYGTIMRRYWKELFQYKDEFFHYDLPAMV